MKASKIALIVYFIVTSLAIIANISENGTLLLFAKPLIVPTIFFYYFVVSKKINVLFTIAIFSCFLGESIGLMNFDNEIHLIIVPFFVSNILLLIIISKDNSKFQFKFINIISMFIIMLFLAYLWYWIVDLFLVNNSLILIFQIAIYGLSLLALGISCGYKIISRINYANISLTIYFICILISGVFYIIYLYEYKIIILDIIHFFTQMISYYFLVHFMIYQEKSREQQLKKQSIKHSYE